MGYGQRLSSHFLDQPQEVRVYIEKWAEQHTSLHSHKAAAWLHLKENSMKSFYRQLTQAVVTSFLAIFLITTGASAADWTMGPGIQLAKVTLDTPASQPSPPGLDKGNPKVQAVMAVQGRNAPGLMARAGVVGTAIGQTEDGEVALMVLTETAAVAAGLPDRVDGVPVVKLVTGKIKALKKPTPGTTIDPTARFARPVPIGVSTGNAYECSAGTIGARVMHGSQVYALSNNHVYALENSAPSNSEVLQPGRYDTRCINDPANIIGTLYDFEPIVFSTSADNVIDAAIALSDKANLGNATPSNGYGVPKSATVAAVLGDAVQKYGRTSSLTKGAISGLNVILNVGYSAGTARFVDQILVTSRKAFIKAGDSGSLLVTDPDRNPVGLLFAGDGSGHYAFANPIGPVLQRFNISIDGE